ncbi:FAD-dependent oxidoreductase [Paenibacillus sp. CAU 1782]
MPELKKGADHNGTVREVKEPLVSHTSSKNSPKLKLVVVGNGMAGIRCVEEILKLDRHRFEITVIGDEPHPNYNRILLSKVLQGGTTMDEIVLNPLSWYGENGITLITGDRVTRIEPTSRFVETASGGVYHWDRLVLATGSSAFVPPIIGVDKKGVIVFRKLEDCEAMMQASEQYRKAAVIGGGLLGLEAARGLLNLGMETEVIHNASYLMNRQLDATSAAMLRIRLEEQGMRFRMNAQTARILGMGRAKGLQFSDGTKLDADLIVLAVGIKPNLALAAACGIKTNRAICVDDYMRTSAAHIYAVGECAEHRGIAYGLVAPLFEQATVLAAELCGIGTEPYRGTVPYAQLKVAGVEVFSAGLINEGEAQTAIRVEDGINGVYRKITMDEGKVAGAILFGDSTDAPALLKLIKSSSPVAELAVFHGSGSGEGEGGLSAAEKAAVAMPGGENVCACNAVNKAAIVKAIQDGGLETVEQVKQATRASGSCGGCQPVVSAILSVVRSGKADNPAGGAEAPAAAVAADADFAVCGCTTMNHETLKAKVQEQAAFPLGELLASLEWRTDDGCDTCLPAIRYYRELGCEMAGRESNASVKSDVSVKSGVIGKSGESEVNEKIEENEKNEKNEKNEESLLGGGFWSRGDEDCPVLGPIQLAGPSPRMPGGAELRQLFDHWTSTWQGRLLPASLAPALSAGAGYPVGLPVRDIALSQCPAGWELFAGGHAELPVRQSDLIGLAENLEEALDLADACLQLYREDAYYGEMMGEWMERTGLNAVRLRLLDPISRGMLAERLRNGTKLNEIKLNDIKLNEIKLDQTNGTAVGQAGSKDILAVPQV